MIYVSASFRPAPASQTGLKRQDDIPSVTPKTEPLSMASFSGIRAQAANQQQLARQISHQRGWF
jgi:hypothetical protein